MRKSISRETFIKNFEKIYRPWTAQDHSLEFQQFMKSWVPPFKEKGFGSDVKLEGGFLREQKARRGKHNLPLRKAMEYIGKLDKSIFEGRKHEVSVKRGEAVKYLIEEAGLDSVETTNLINRFLGDKKYSSSTIRFMYYKATR